MGISKDLSGQRFGRLVAISAEKDSEGRRYIWTCKCDCGNYTKAGVSALLRGNKRSCGCLQKDALMNRNMRHGYSKERLYRVWKGMRSRCNNPNHTSYAKYGGRGIKVCDEWNSDYLAFREWAVLNGYDEEAEYGECTLDRIDVDLGYTPDNCRWVSESSQANNKSDNRLITLNGETKNIATWAGELGIDSGVIYARLNNLGWSEEKALTTPVRKCTKKK